MEEEGDEEGGLRLDKAGDGFEGQLYVLLDRFAGNAHLFGYFGILQALLAAEQVYLLLLRGKLRNGLIDQGKVFLCGNGDLCCGGYVIDMLFILGLVPAVSGHFLQAVKRIVAGNDKQVSRKIIDAHQR